MSAAAAAPDLEPLGAQEVLEHMVREYHPRLNVACSWRRAGTDRIEWGLHFPARS